MWRKLFIDHEGFSVAVLDVKCKQYQEPARAKDLKELEKVLPEWKQWEYK